MEDEFNFNLSNFTGINNVSILKYEHVIPEYKVLRNICHH